MIEQIQHYALMRFHGVPYCVFAAVLVIFPFILTKLTAKGNAKTMDTYYKKVRCADCGWKGNTGKQKPKCGKCGSTNLNNI